MWDPKKQNNTKIKAKQKQTHKQREQTYDCKMGGGWGRMENRKGIKKYKLSVKK